MARIARRECLRIAGATLASAELPRLVAADETWSGGTERPVFRLPEGAIDCHMHVYDDRFPVAPGTTLRPPNATVAQYRRVQTRIGVKRNVVVTPSTYGTDNRCTLAALAQFGADARGVAIVDGTVSDDELRALDRGGIRAIRFNLSYPGATTLDMLAPLAARCSLLAARRSPRVSRTPAGISSWWCRARGCRNSSVILRCCLVRSSSTISRMCRSPAGCRRPRFAPGNASSKRAVRGSRCRGRTSRASDNRLLLATTNFSLCCRAAGD